MSPADEFFVFVKVAKRMNFTFIIKINIFAFSIYFLMALCYNNIAMLNFML